MGTAESSTVATETENQNPSELLQKHASVFSVCFTHTHMHAYIHGEALRWSFVCMKMEIMSKKNITKKYHFKKEIKNLYTLHVLIKVTEPVRILDSSCI